MEDELMPINVWLAGRSYRLRIKPEEEESVRKAVKMAENKMLELRNYYSGKDEQDFMAMVLLMYATDSSISAMGNPVVQNELQQLTQKIDKAIGEQSV